MSDKNGHGTHTAGAVGARTNTTRGVVAAGLATFGNFGPGVDIDAERFQTERPRRPESLLRAARWTGGGAAVASETFGRQDLIESIAEEVAERWRRGERPTAEEYAARHPDQGQGAYLPHSGSASSVASRPQETKGSTGRHPGREPPVQQVHRIGRRSTDGNRG